MGRLNCECDGSFCVSYMSHSSEKLNLYKVLYLYNLGIKLSSPQSCLMATSQTTSAGTPQQVTFLLTATHMHAGEFDKWLKVVRCQDDT